MAKPSRVSQWGDVWDSFPSRRRELHPWSSLHRNRCCTRTKRKYTPLPKDVKCRPVLIFFPLAAMVILKINFQVPDQFCSRIILLQCAAFLLHCEICAGILWNWVWSLWCIMFQKSPYQHNSSLSWAEEEICYPFHVWSYRDSGTFTKCWILKTICILL